MTWVSTILASISLAAAVVLYVKVDHLERDLGAGRAATREARVPEPRALPLPELPMTRADDAPQTSESTGRRSASSPARGDPRAMTVEQRLARLEERQEHLETEPRPVWGSRGRAFARNVDDLAKRLSLTSTQRARVEDAVARGRQRVDEILKIPDETGKSPSEQRAEARKKLEEAMKNGSGTGGVLAFAGDFMSYREKKIPGRGETYGEAIDRVRKDTREEIAGALDTKQEELLKDTNVDGLLGEGGQMSFALSIGDAGDGGQAGIMVETHAEDVVESGEPPEPAGTEGR
jgi:hypothetical protein